MESLINFSIEVTRWLQENYPQLESFFALMSDIGRFQVYLAVVPLIYWCINKRLGIALVYLLALADMASNILKQAFRDPRPYWLEPEIGLSEEPSYGIPSGHAPTSTVAYGTLAAWVRRSWMWLLAGVMIFLIALSRVYLGVHDIPDVVAGFLLGCLVLAGYFVWRRAIGNRFHNRILGQKLLLAVLLPTFLVLVYVAILLAIGESDPPPEWALFAEAAEEEGLNNIASGFGTLLGLGIGFLFESSRVRFQVDGPIWKRALRYILGMVVLVAIWQGLDTIFPEEPLWLGLPLRALRYLLMSLWAAYYAPLLFVRLRLAEARPEPETSLTIQDVKR